MAIFSKATTTNLGRHIEGTGSKVLLNYILQDNCVLDSNITNATKNELLIQHAAFN
jgi:hypothetical protein